MKKILILLICLGILMTSTLTVFAGDEDNLFSATRIIINI